MASSPDSNEGIVLIDGLVVDAATGEVLEWPEGVPTPDRVRYLIRRARDASANEKEWKKAGSFFRQALGKLLADLGERQLKTDDGSATAVAYEREYAPIDDLQRVFEEHELTLDEQFDIIGCTKTLDPSMLHEVAKKHGGSVAKAVEDIIRKTPVAFTRVDAPRQVAPTIRTAKRRD